MKKFIILFAIAFIFASCTFTSGPQKTMKDEICRRQGPHTTLADEVEEQMKKYKCHLTWHEDWYKVFSEDGETEKAEENRLAVIKDKEALTYLESIKTKYPDLYDQPSFTTYRLTYVKKDSLGNSTLELCLGTFNNQGEMVAFQETSTSKREILGDMMSIPDFHQYESEL